jgi:hypothetical protein
MPQEMVVAAILLEDTGITIFVSLDCLLSPCKYVRDGNFKEEDRI